MQLKHLNSASIELEIRKALLDHKDVEMAADQIIKQFGVMDLTRQEIETVSNFIFHAGLFVALNDFLIKKLEDKKTISWAHLCESIFESTPLIEPEVKRFLIEGAESENQLFDLSRSKHLDYFEAELIEQRKLRRKSIKDDISKFKQTLLGELETLRSQNLIDSEEALLQRLLNYFPTDEDLQKLKNQLRERKALGVFSSTTSTNRPHVRRHLYQNKDEQTEMVLHEIDLSLEKALKKNKELLPDFAVTHLFWDEDERALRLLEKAPQSPSTDWLKAELMLRSRQFSNLLSYLLALEIKYASDSDSIYAIHYMRAQALWGLEQKYAALEMMQTLIDQQPDYRAAHSLLQEWKEEIG